MRYYAGIGQDSHRFLPEGTDKQCIIAGLPFEGAPGMDADSDGDVVFHAICNAISSLTHVPILGGIAIDLCRNQGLKDSRVFLDKALETLGKKRIEHIALTIEGKRPKFQKRADDIRKSVAAAVSVNLDQVGITFTSGDGLTAFGRGEGMMCYCILTVSEAKKP